LSEYQYYEFQAIDRPLTEEEQQAVVACRGESAWQEVDALIQKSQAKPYDEAVQLLLKLRNLARHQGQELVFQQRLNRICEQSSGRSALLRRLRNVGLYQSQT
jgi:hypothetical protein